MTDYQTLTSTTVYDGKIFSVRSDEVSMPGGGSARRDVVTKDNAVAVVALNNNNEIALIRQYRHPMGEKLWELPAGLIDVEGEHGLVTAQRELYEEVGVTAALWRELVTIAASPGFTDERTTIYLAGGLVEVGRPEAQDEEADLELLWVPLADARAMVLAGQIINAHTVAGILAVGI